MCARRRFDINLPFKEEAGHQWSRLFLLLALLRLNTDGIGIVVLKSAAGQQLTPRPEGARLLLLLQVGPVLGQRQLLDGSSRVGLAVALLGLLQILVGSLLVLEGRLFLRSCSLGGSQLGHGAENQSSVQVGEGVVGGDDGGSVPGTRWKISFL